MTLDAKVRIERQLAQLGFRQILRRAQRNPEETMHQILNVASRFTQDSTYRQAIEAISERVNKDPRVTQKLRRLLKNPDVVETLFATWVLNSLFLTAPIRRRKIEAGLRVPTTLQIDPTSACNLRCPGCWAGEYGQSDRISPERLDQLFDEMKELGIYWVTLSGGEPLIYPHLLELMEKHNDMFFMAYTNGTLLDDQMADEMARLGNFTPAFSLEGGRERTDARRGNGTFDQVITAMERCSERGIPFGASLTATRENVRELYSDDFMAPLNERGVLYIWVFHYIPIGRSPDLQLMVTPEQRLWMVKRMRELRATYPMAMVDFWNDGHQVEGCIAGGRLYAHINAAGDVEPCGFVHFAIDNINETPLADALGSPLFEAFADRQPFNDNLLAPCPFIDNPQALREIIAETEAAATHDGADSSLEGETAEHLDETSERWRDLSQGADKDLRQRNGIT